MASDDAKGAKGPKLKQIGIAAVVVVGLAGGVKGFILGGGASAAAGAGAGPVTTTTKPHGPVVILEPVTLNIDAGRFLKVGLALQIAHDFKSSAGAHGPDSDDPTKGYARAVDLVIDMLGGRTYDELVKPEGRRKVKEELAHLLEEEYPGEVEGVYFTEFVMQ